MSNEEMFATSGSAANSSTLNPGGTLNELIAVNASSLAGITFRGPGGPDIPGDSCPRTATGSSSQTSKPVVSARIDGDVTATRRLAAAGRAAFTVTPPSRRGRAPADGARPPAWQTEPRLHPRTFGVNRRDAACLFAVRSSIHLVSRPD